MGRRVVAVAAGVVCCVLVSYYAGPLFRVLFGYLILRTGHGGAYHLSVLLAYIASSVFGGVILGLMVWAISRRVWDSLAGVLVILLVGGAGIGTAVAISGHGGGGTLWPHVLKALAWYGVYVLVGVGLAGLALRPRTAAERKDEGLGEEGRDETGTTAGPG
jgi:hypothetical protein